MMEVLCVALECWNVESWCLGWVIWRKADNKGVEQCEELIWQALLVIWMWSMDVLMGELEEGRQQRSEAMTVNGCEVDTKIWLARFPSCAARSKRLAKQFPKVTSQF